MHKVAVVILSWNGRKFLEQFLPSVLEYSEGNKIVVADNGSTDDSVDFVEKNFPSIDIIRILKNEGFSKGYNLALKQIQAEYYILLNSDVEVTPNWIAPIIQQMDQDTSIAAVQPRINSFHNKSMFEYAGAAGGFIDKYGYPFCRGRLFDTLEKDEGQYNDIQEVFWATGACLFVRAEYFWEAGALDEDFFAHMEEIDLCWRLRALDYKIMANGNSGVFHIGGGTLSKSNPRKTYLNFRNGLILLYKNLPGDKLHYIFFRMILDGIAGVKFLFSESFEHFLAVIKAHFYFYFRIIYFSKKRKNTQALIKVHKKGQIYPGSVVYDYFLKNKKLFRDLKF